MSIPVLTGAFSNTTASGTLTASDAVVGAPVGDGTLVSGASTAGSIVYAVVPDGYQGWTLLIKGYVSGTIYTEASNNSTNGTDGDWVEVKGRRTGTSPGTESVLYAMVANGYYRGNAAAFKYIRARLIGGTGATIRWDLSLGQGATFLNSGLPASTSVIGAVTQSGTWVIGAGAARIGQMQLTGSSTASALGLGSSITAYGNLRVTTEPSSLFNDPFDGTVIDVTDRWNAAVVAGGMTVTQASGGLVFTTNTTINASAFIDSKPTFAPLGLSFLAYGEALKLEAQTSNFFVTNQHRFWGLGDRPTTFAYATPLKNAAGFEIDGTGQLLCCVYSNGTRIYSTSTSLTGVNLNTLITPSAGYCRFGIAQRADTYVFYIGTTEYPAASFSVSSASFSLSDIQSLPIRHHAINNSSAPSAVSTFIVTTLAVGDTGAGGQAIADGIFGWRKSTVKAASTAAVAADTAVVVGIHPSSNGVNIFQFNGVAPLMGNGVTGTGSQRNTIASDNSAVPTWGHGATGAAVPANAVLEGRRAATANPTNATAGNTVAAMADKAGRTVVTQANVRELIGVQQTAVAATAETTIVTAGGAGVFNDITQLIITTAGAAAATITIKDATAGTTRMVLNYPNAALAPGAPLIINFNPPLPQATANANWTVTNSVATATNVTAVFAKNL